MGNIGSHTTQVTSSSGGRIEHRPITIHTINTKEDKVPHHQHTNNHQQIRVLPELEGRQRLRHTDNGNILQSGGTLSGRQVSIRRSDAKLYLPSQRFSFHNDDVKAKYRPVPSSQNRINSQIKSYKSEPDLRLPIAGSMETARAGPDRSPRKKYKAPAPPPVLQKNEINPTWDEDLNEPTLRRPRLFKTRVESKKDSSNLSSLEQLELKADIEEKILIHETPTIYARPKKQHPFTDINMELKRSFLNSDFHRDEPSGKESSTPELSPQPRIIETKPREFYFGMEDSDVSSSQPDDETEESIALRLRPVLPRKPLQIAHFSPAAAWRLLDVRPEDSGISGDVRPIYSHLWTPQQDLGDNSSVDERMDLMKPYNTHRAHVLSLSLPRDLQPSAAFTNTNKSASSLRKLKRSVSGMLNNLTSKKEVTTRELLDDANWLLSRSAPNSINNEDEVPFAKAAPTHRLIYLPDNMEKPRHLSKSCEDFLNFETEAKSMMDPVRPSDSPKKQKKFTFQSTVRQIERRKMAEKLSKEAEKKEKQRIREIVAMQQVEEEFQRKRDKEKANIRNQLRLYAMDETQWGSLPFELNKLEERQEPDGALSSRASSPAQTKTHVTQELSEFRQLHREYKEYRGLKMVPNRQTTTVYPEVTYNMPNVKKPVQINGNYRKEFAFGMRTKSVDSQSDESPKMYRNNFSSITRF